MEAKKITDAIRLAIDKDKLETVQKGDLTILIDSYSDLLSEYAILSQEDKETLFKDVKRMRPMIGKKLQEQFEKDLNK